MKATMATVKSFIRKNRANLLIATLSRFNGMVDGVDPCDNRGFTAALPDNEHSNYTLGILGAWFVGSGRDYVTPLALTGFTGFHIYNSCGSFDLAIPS